MSKVKQLFTKVAIQLDGAEITYEELAQKTGRSFNYIRNNSKSLAKAYGFNFVRANKRETLPRVLDTTNFKRVINTYLASNNLPCAYPNLEPYTGRDVTPQTVARLLQGSVAKALYKGNEVVLDCDSPEMVAQFEDLISQTEAWVSEDRSKAHIVFKTDKWIPTRLNVKPKLDILGNATPNQMRYLKPNKHHNGLSPMMLTDEVLNRIHSSIDE